MSSKVVLERSLLQRAKGNKFLERFVVLTRDFIFAYEQDKKGVRGKQIMRLPIRSVCGVQNVSDAAFGQTNGFQVVFGEGIVYFAGRTAGERDEWIQKIREECCWRNGGIMMPMYHPGAFVGSKWTCCEKKDPEIAGCVKAHVYDVQDQLHQFHVLYPQLGDLMPRKGATVSGAVAMGTGLLLVSSRAVMLMDDAATITLVRWPKSGLRRFGHEHDCFKFEAGSRCETGEGWYCFQTICGKLIVEVLEGAVVQHALANNFMDSVDQLRDMKISGSGGAKRSASLSSAETKTRSSSVTISNPYKFPKNVEVEVGVTAASGSSTGADGLAIYDPVANDPPPRLNPRRTAPGGAPARAASLDTGLYDSVEAGMYDRVADDARRPGGPDDDTYDRVARDDVEDDRYDRVAVDREATLPVRPKPAPRPSPAARAPLRPHEDLVVYDPVPRSSSSVAAEAPYDQVYVPPPSTPAPAPVAHSYDFVFDPDAVDSHTYSEVVMPARQEARYVAFTAAGQATAPPTASAYQTPRNDSIKRPPSGLSRDAQGSTRSLVSGQPTVQYADMADQRK